MAEPGHGHPLWLRKSHWSCQLLSWARWDGNFCCREGGGCACQSTEKSRARRDFLGELRGSPSPLLSTPSLPPAEPGTAFVPQGHAQLSPELRDRVLGPVGAAGTGTTPHPAVHGIAATLQHPRRHCHRHSSGHRAPKRWGCQERLPPKQSPLLGPGEHPSPNGEPSRVNPVWSSPPAPRSYLCSAARSSLPGCSPRRWPSAAQSPRAAVAATSGAWPEGVHALGPSRCPLLSSRPCPGSALSHARRWGHPRLRIPGSLTLFWVGIAHPGGCRGSAGSSLHTDI